MNSVVAFSKGSRVEFFFRGKTQHAIVENVTKGGETLHVLCDDDSRVKGTARFFKPSNKPAPVRERKVCPFCRGDRVEWTDPRDGKVQTGVVKNIGLTADRMSVDVDGTTRSIKWQFWNFRLTTKPAPAPAKEEKGKLTFVQVDVPNAMDDYAVTKFKATPVRKGVWEGHEGNGYHAIITRGKIPVAEVYNEGVGGTSQLMALPKIPASSVTGIMTSLKSSYVQFGGKAEDFTEDLLDVWVEWYVSGKNSGVLWESEVKEMHAICEKFRK
jgi:hypothetical protein